MLVYILIAIVMFGILIAVHEFGHFIAAKSLGVKVNEFAIGMGPALLSKQKGETLYSLRAFPIGGFCAMEGEEEASDDPRSFHNKPAWKKFIILVAGAFMNFLTGFLIILVLFPSVAVLWAPVITGYMEGAEQLAQAGLQTGDLLYRIDGHRIYFNEDALTFLSRAGDRVDPGACAGMGNTSFWRTFPFQPIFRPRRTARPSISAASILVRWWSPRLVWY